MGRQLSARHIVRCRIAEIVLLALVLTLGRIDVAGAADPLHVSPTGDDSGDGTELHPLRTIGQALALASPGDTIEVAAGQYPPFRTNRLFTEPVTIHGAGAGASVVKGDHELQSDGAVEFWGAAGVTIEGLTITGGRVYITDERNHTLGRGSTDITLREDELVGEEGLGAGATIRSGSERIAIERCFIHDLVLGINGPNYRIISGVDTGLPLVNGVTIRRNRIEHVKEDAIQFADWKNVVIEENVMRDATHDPPPAPQYHNDLIQFTGYSSNVRISGNYLAESSQEIFIQPAFGPIEDVVVENNVLWDSRAYAVQSQAVAGLRFIYNTLWDSNYGMAIRDGPHEEPAATDGVVVGNIIDKLGYPAGTVEEYNLIGIPQRAAGYGPEDLFGADPGFAAAEQGDLHLLDESVAIGAGTASYAPPVDLEGRRRLVPPSLGAYEGALPPPAAPEEDPPAGPGTGSPPSPAGGSPGAGDIGGGVAATGVTGASAPGGREQGQGAAPREEGAYPLRVVLPLPGGPRLTAEAMLDAPRFCDARCAVTVAGRVVVKGGGRSASAPLMPRHAALAALVQRGLRLSARPRVAFTPHRSRRAVARLRLRFAAGSRRTSSSLRVRFGRHKGGSRGAGTRGPRRAPKGLARIAR